MKTERNIFLAFILNFTFSILEFFGGIFTGSVAIISDAVHDIGDAASIGAAYFLERKSKRQPDARYTYGYARYSVLGSLLTMSILLIGSALVIYNAVRRILAPVPLQYNGMIVFAAVGVCVNLCAATVTREGGSLNQKAVNLHMIEDVLGWILVLLGAIVMKYTEFVLLDPILSICVAVFILANAIKGLKEVCDILLEKAPSSVDLQELKAHILETEGVVDVHHVHVWSLDGQRHYATLHLVVEGDFVAVKAKVREELAEHGISHATLEMERLGEECAEKECKVCDERTSHCHHHHHH